MFSWGFLRFTILLPNYMVYVRYVLTSNLVHIKPYDIRKLEETCRPGENGLLVPVP